MSASSRDIEREVEASRANLEETVEALKDKMSIGQMVDEAARYFGDSGGSELVGNLGRQMRDNPLPLVLVGVGLAWLMSGRGQPHVALRGGGRDDRFQSLGAEDYRRTFGEGSVYSGAQHADYASPSTGSYDSDRSEHGRSGGALSGAGNAVRGAAGSVRDAASGVASGLASAASGVASGVGAVASGLSAAASGLGSAASSLGSGAAHVGRSAYSAAGTAAGGARSGIGTAWRGGAGAYRSASDFGAGAYSGASRAASGARRSFSDVLETEPLVVAGVGLAVGAAIGALLPRTQYETRAFGDASTRMREEAEAYAREQFERGKAVAEEAYRTAKAEAQAHGLTSFGSDSVAGKIGEVARATIERVKEKAAEEGIVGGQSDEGSGSGERDRTTTTI